MIERDLRMLRDRRDQLRVEAGSKEIEIFCTGLMGLGWIASSFNHPSFPYDLSRPVVYSMRDRDRAEGTPCTWSLRD